MKLTLDLPTVLSLAIQRRAKARSLTPEDATIETLTTALAAIGEIEGDVASRPALRIVKKEGTA